MKNTIKINESQLRKIVAENVKKVLRESECTSPKECAERLAQMIGAICDEMSKGGECPSYEEMAELYDYATTINGYYQDNVLKEDIDFSKERRKYNHYLKAYEKSDRSAVNMMRYLRHLFQLKDNNRDLSYASVVAIIEGRCGVV